MGAMSSTCSRRRSATPPVTPPAAETESETSEVEEMPEYPLPPDLHPTGVRGTWVPDGPRVSVPPPSKSRTEGSGAPPPPPWWSQSASHAGLHRGYAPGIPDPLPRTTGSYIGSSEYEIRRAAVAFDHAVGGGTTVGEPWISQIERYMRQHGPLPPVASSRQRRYYVMRETHPGGVQVCVGQTIAAGILGGNWLSHGTAPQGFFSLEAAMNFAHRRYPHLEVIGLRVLDQAFMG